MRGDTAGGIGWMRGNLIGVAEPLDEPEAGEFLGFRHLVAVIRRGLAVFDADGQQVGVDIARPEVIGTWPGTAVAPGSIFDQAALRDHPIAPDNEMRPGVNLAGLEVARHILCRAGHGGAMHDDIAQRLPAAANRSLRVAIFVVWQPEG